MSDELDLDLEEGQEEQIKNRELKRNKDLSDKLRLEREDKEKLIAEKEKLQIEKEDAVKQADFFKNFSQATSKYPGASEYQDQIKEKVMSGYDVEDATISILAREGKFQAPPVPVIPKDSPAGGSATNAIRTGGEKSISEMTQQERRDRLMQAESESGDLSRILRM